MLIYTNNNIYNNIYNLQLNNIFHTIYLFIHNNIFVNIVSPGPKKHHSEPAVFGYTCNNKTGPKRT